MDNKFSNLKNKGLAIANGHNIEVYPIDNDDQKRAFANRLIALGGPLTPKDKRLLTDIIEKDDLSKFDTLNGLSSVNINKVNVYRATFGVPVPEEK